MTTDHTKYEKAGDGRYWVPASDIAETKYDLQQYEAGFFPENFVSFSRFIHLYGKNKFGGNWLGIELFSSPITPDLGAPSAPKAPNTPSVPRPSNRIHSLDTLIQHGEYNYGDFRKVGESSEYPGGCEDITVPVELREFCVTPISQAKAIILQDRYNRMVATLDSIRNLLFEGAMTAYLDPAKQYLIEPKLWASSLWDVAIYGGSYSEGDIVIEEKSGPVDIYFIRSEVNSLFEGLNASKPIKLQDTSNDAPELSPYILAAIRISKKYNITEGTPQKLETLTEDIFNDWPEDCGTKSRSKAKILAKMVRWPSHESGGNR